MSAELQRIVDALGSQLQRAVAIDDPRFRLQVYSPHYGPVDDTRLDSILHREAPQESVAWVLDQGVAEATDVVRLPANPDLGLLPRVITPIRHDGVHLGYLVLVDAEESLPHKELAHVRVAADAAGLVLFRQQLLSELERGRERELLRDLLAEDMRLRRDAARQLAEEELFATGSPVTALVVQPSGGPVDDERARTALDAALEAARRQVSARHALPLARADHGVVLVSATDPALQVAGMDGLALQLRDRLVASLPEGGDWRVVVGISDTHAQVVDAITAYRQARQAAQVARIVPSFGSVVSWGQLGIYRILAQLPIDELSGDMLHPGLLKLFASEAAESLVRTLECYLDRAGDAKATSAELFVHRTSLYYRLGRIEEIAQVDLHDGETRLALHLGLKMARLAGLHPLEPEQV